MGTRCFSMWTGARNGMTDQEGVGTTLNPDKH